MALLKRVIIIGNGCRANPELVEALCNFGIPVLTTWMAADLVDDDNPSFCGRPGVICNRAANIIIQKADQLFIIGARMDYEQIAYNYKKLATHASEVTVYDIDKAELDKLPYPWKKVQCDLSTIKKLDGDLGNPEWMKWCKDLYNRFSFYFCEHSHDEIDPYWFLEMLHNFTDENDIFVMGNGLAPCTFYQAYRVKAGQRVMGLSTFGPMGSDIPMSIGACIASGKKRIICVTGDGGFQLNLQELEVAKRLNLPIKFFVFKNDGYGTIYNAQDLRFGQRVGSDRESGLTLLDLSFISRDYSYNEYKLITKDCLGTCLTQVLDEPGLSICGVKIPSNFKPQPKVGSTLLPDGTYEQQPYENPSPQLPADEMKEIMDYGN